MPRSIAIDSGHNTAASFGLAGSITADPTDSTVATMLCLGHRLAAVDCSRKFVASCCSLDTIAGAEPSRFC